MYAEGVQYPHKSIQYLMGLGDDSARFRRFVKALGTSADENLDKSKRWTQQPEHIKRRFFASTTNRRPASFYPRMHMHRIRRRVSSEPAAADDENDDDDDDGDGNGNEPEPQNPGPARTPSPTVSAVDSDTAFSDLLARAARKPAPKSYAQLHAGCTGGTAMECPDCKPMYRFLQELEQPLGHLLPALRDVGIRNAPALRALANLHDKGDFLYRVLPRDEITSFEHKMLIDGLAVLAGAGQGTSGEGWSRSR
ncbi:uncharacterized protein BXZ73DRAFT_95636 [Epithele typhae]|uniref:uncharacterized protein n=1 Tax=Epithele typhae TaxID=378194 RepID=UPI002008B45F|nr:uncharacterized protein BXZ73DRAFT_95636 [Epithele typhae]KAH9946134.1 hypothetical protein BXZ73DRAFT_95636 [Epithele typhae]